TERVVVDLLIVIVDSFVDGLIRAGDRGVQVRYGLGGLNLTTALTGSDGVAHSRQFSKDNLTEAGCCDGCDTNGNGVGNYGVLSGVNPLMVLGVSKFCR